MAPFLIINILQPFFHEKTFEFLKLSGVDLDLVKLTNIPPCKLLLEEISSLEQPLSNSIKFLSALEQEMKWAGAKIEAKKKRSDEGKKKIQVENSVDNGDNADSNVINLECGITLKAVCTMSTEEVL